MAKYSSKGFNPRNRPPGRGKPPEYGTWLSMKTRCYNEKYHGFHNYGGRGITVCPEWLHDFDKFLEDMGPRPEGCTIDRIDNNQGYSKANCRWATDIEQHNNTSRNVYYPFNGEQKTIAEISALVGIGVTVIRKRIHQYGWDIESATNKPVRPKKKNGCKK